MPDSVNPTAEELRYTPADEGRDVAARLTEYAQQGVPAAEDPVAIELGLQEALRLAQQSAREYKTIEETYLLAAIRLLVQRHRWSPQLFNDTSVFVSGAADEGAFSSTLDLVNELRATKQLPFGGSVEARWVWEAADQLRRASSERYTQSSFLALSANVPLLRGFGSVSQEDLIQAERDLVYAARAFERARRELVVSLASDYFRLLELLARIDNQERQVRSLETLTAATRALVEAGRRSGFDRDQATSNELSARATLASLREQYVLQLDRFKVRLGLTPDARVRITPLVLGIREPEISLDEATALGLEYRLDLQSDRDRVEDARRRVRNARDALRADLSVVGDVSVPTDPDAFQGGLKFDPNELDYSAGLRLSLPLDRQRERLELRRSIIDSQQAERDYLESRDTTVVSIRSALRSIDLARFQLELAQRGVEINERRLEELRLKADSVDLRTKLDAQTDYTDAQNARDRAVTELRNAILNYLLESDQLRVSRDGAFEPLPGMETSATEPADRSPRAPTEP